MVDYPPSLPVIKLPNRVSVGSGSGSPAVDGKKYFFSPNSRIRTPIFRTNRFIVRVGSIASLFLLITVIFLFGGPHVEHSSKWLKTVMKNRPQLTSLFPGFLLDANPTDMKEASLLGEANNSRTPADAPYGSPMVTLDSKVATAVGNPNGNLTAETGAKNGTADRGNGRNKKRAKMEREKAWLEKMSKCDIFDGKWVKDESLPLYERGSCDLMDESFNCHRNGRPEYGFEKFRWQPYLCNLPRLDGKRALKILRGKRIVYVGDSLSRNMWESMVCLMRSSVENKSRVFEASGRDDLKKAGAYSFIFLDYNCTLEYMQSSFLVQEWEVPLGNGSMKETLRIDLVEKFYDSIKDANILIFNTGNWWTHEKTSKGESFYQEGDHIHPKLDVLVALDKAMTTWARWIEANVNLRKTSVFFRSYSFSHFSKGEWNTGGRCDSKEPIVDEKDLLKLDEISPPIPQMLDKAMEKVRANVFYLNVTRMTNYRSDAHPSLYRKPNMTEEEKREFATHQDCSHWCLPGVPDTWNQLLYTRLMFSHRQQKFQEMHAGDVN